MTSFIPDYQMGSTGGGEGGHLIFMILYVSVDNSFQLLVARDSIQWCIKMYINKAVHLTAQSTNMYFLLSRFK